MYKPNSLEQERISWKTVIYFNVVHSLKHILNTLEAWDDTADDGPDYSPEPHARGFPDQPSPSTSLPNNLESNGSFSTSSRFDASFTMQIAGLRRRLNPLIATDEPLADRLSGGITVSGSGKGGVFVRSGWQARTIENALGRMRTRRPAADDAKKGRNSHSQDGIQDALVQDVAHMLKTFEKDIKELWDHPIVKALISKRRLKLDEWSELYVTCHDLVSVPLTELPFSAF